MEQAERAARLEKWLHTFGSKGTLNTTVADPKPSRSGGMTSAVFGPTTLYTVTTESPDDGRRDQWTVERSMSDFVALRAALVQRFPGAVMGHLPESKVTDLAKSKEEKSTKTGEILNHFLRFLCRHPFISQDQVFLAFLSVSSKFSDALKAVAPASAPSGKFRISKMVSSTARNKRKSLEREIAMGLSDEPQSAPDWWREAIDLATEPSDPLKLAKDVLGELERVKKRISDLKMTIRDFREKLKAVGGTCLDLHKSFQAWLAVEYSPDAVSVTATEGGDSNGTATTTITTSDAEGGAVMVTMSMPVLLAENSVRFEKQGLLHQQMALDSAATLLSAVREEILVLDAMKEEITAARDAVIRVEDAKIYLQKKERELQIAEDQARAERGLGSIQGGSDAAFAYEDAGDPNFERKTRGARKAKEDAIAALETATAVASTLTRSTLNLELNFFREERIIRSDKFFTEFARVHSEYSAKSLEMWTMKAIHGLPPPPVNLSPAMPKQLPEVRSRVGRLETAKSYMTKSGVYDSLNSEEEYAANGSSRHASEVAEEDEDIGIQEQLVEWGLDIAWDPNVPRPVQVVFDFQPEQDDELEAKEGDRGTAVPFDEDRQWLHVKLTNGKSGIIPTDFVRLIIVKTSQPGAKSRRPSNMTEVSVATNDAMHEELEGRLKEMEEEMNRMRSEYEALRKEAKEREEYMSTRANELANANQVISQLRVTNKNLQLELDNVTTERDRAIADRDRAYAERDQALMNQSGSSQPQVVRAQVVQASSASSSPGQDDEPLPPNWVKGFDKSRNRYFYHNTVTKESVWKRPQMSRSQGGSTKRKQGEE